MPQTLTMTRMAALILLGVAGLAVGPAVHARQSDSDLRKQNQQLSTQVQDLLKELEAARRENESLKQRLAQLERELAAARQGGRTPAQTQPDTPEVVTVDESIPFNSPRALFRAVLASHDEAFGEMEMGRPGDGKRRAYMKRLESWKAAAERHFRGPIQWHVRAIDARTEDRDRDRSFERIITLVAVDPQTDVELGAPFDVQLSQTLVDRLARYEQRGELGVMILRGVLIPTIRINEDRTERGSFDNPPFLGPFAEFTYAVDVKSLMPVEEDKKEQAATSPAAPAPRP